MFLVSFPCFAVAKQGIFYIIKLADKLALHCRGYNVKKEIYDIIEYRNMIYKTKNEKETISVADSFAKKLRGGEVILLYGNLGAGKTVFAKGVAKGLGIKGVVKSPTFNLMKCYKGKINLCHVDAYRLENLDDLLDIGLEDYVDNDTIIIVEWAERVKGVEKFGEKSIKIKMEHGKKEKMREIDIE